MILTPLRNRKSAFGAIALCFCLFLISPALAQKKIQCPDGVHYEIDVNQISIQYQGTQFISTLSGLGALGARIAVEPKTLQTAAEATQQWNEFLKGLVVGYNSCVITKKEYQEGLWRIYPRLNEDAMKLESFRQKIVAGHTIDEKRLKKILDDFESNLRKFAKIAQKEVDYDRIADIVNDQLKKFNWKEVYAEIERARNNNQGNAIATRIFWLTDEPGASISLGPCPGEKCLEFELGELRPFKLGPGGIQESLFQGGRYLFFGTRPLTIKGSLFQTIKLKGDGFRIKRDPESKCLLEMNNPVRMSGNVTGALGLCDDLFAVYLGLYQDSAFEMFTLHAKIKLTVIDLLSDSLRIKLEVWPPDPLTFHSPCPGICLDGITVQYGQPDGSILNPTFPGASTQPKQEK